MDQQLGPKKGERNKREQWEGVGALRILEHFGHHPVDFGSHFGAHWISEGRSAGRFSMYLALPQKIEKQTYVNNYTAKVGSANYTQKR